ncbi:OmpA family protein [Maritimibacter dapengensis]|uniref:OmpA family protein n=1 Tax=Maritimibacter dapengensis TaxID=2836868 RepID=A0ABS6SXB8_9RHOB|nr:OmpA family protein [Maritimibacter dapengensis]MBV7377355.1 OmpA family protein [Maritimibacter dapengensis]
MRLTNIVLIPAIFLAAAALAILAAWTSVGVIEKLSESAIERELILQGEDWAHVDTDGLQVFLTGTAPSETDRFQALSIAGSQVEASRVIDQMDVPSSRAVTPPRFSIEILRNDAGISMIGLIPAETDRAALNERVGRITLDREVADFLESADHPVPDGWDAALDFALFALEELPRAKISMDASRVVVEAIADSADQKANWERDLARRVPGGLRMVANISAPRPVVTPFTARFVIDGEGARFDACTAGTEAGRTRIVAAGIAAGAKGTPDCTIALGVPSSEWPNAVAMGVSALHELGGGSITYADADVTLVAAATVQQRNYDRVVGELENELPEVFSLHASKTPSDDGREEGPPEFTAALDSEGKVQLRGRLSDEQQRTITQSVARARFGIGNVLMATRLDQNLPQGWSVRVLASLEALSLLDNGKATVQPTFVELRGKTGDQNASAEISRILSEKLGEAEEFRVNVIYDEALDPIAAMPTPRECAEDVNAVIRKSKITFAPGSVEIEASARNTVDSIAEILKNCPDAPMEIGGHTDSQGSEDMNKSLSQQRANSVLNALLARRVLTSNLTAHGYGEEQPIADNDTDEGREANRRIEFRLIGTAELPETGAMGETGEEDISEGAVQTPDEELGTVRPRARPTDVVEDVTEATTETDEGSGDEAALDDTGATDTEEGAPEATAEAEPADADQSDTPTGDTQDTVADETTTPDEPQDDTAEADPSESTEADPAQAEAETPDTTEEDPAQAEAETSDATEEVATETEAEADDAATTDVADEGAEDPSVEEATAANAQGADEEPTPQDAVTPSDQAEADADTAEEETDTADTTSESVVILVNPDDNDDTAPEPEEPLGPTIVVHPELEGVRAPPRPEGEG